MALVSKKINGRNYYYSFLSYFLINKPKSFSKYIGVKRPSAQGLARIESRFKDELIRKISSRAYSNLALSKDDVIKSLLFRDLFKKKYSGLTELGKRRYDTGSTIIFTLTTLATEEVDVDLTDVENALNKESKLTQREQISRNMLDAVDSIKRRRELNERYLLELHRMIMASFETKKPGKLRDRQVYLQRRGDSGPPFGAEINYRPPSPRRVEKLLGGFFSWYRHSHLNPIEKAASAHFNLYRIHPFLDGNKRICRLIFNKTLIDNDFPLINISLSKEDYFDALVASVEGNKPKILVDFALKQYYLQVKEFLKGGK